MTTPKTTEPEQAIKSLIERNQVALTRLVELENHKEARRLLSRVLRTIAADIQIADTHAWARGSASENLAEITRYAAEFIDPNDTHLLDLTAEILLRALPGARLQVLPEVNWAISESLKWFRLDIDNKKTDYHYERLAADLRAREHEHRSALEDEEGLAELSPERKADVTIAMIGAMRKAGYAHGWIDGEARYLNSRPSIELNFPGKPTKKDREVLVIFFTLNPAWRPCDFKTIFQAASRTRSDGCNGTWISKLRGLRGTLNHIAEIREEMSEMFPRPVILPPVQQVRDWYGLRRERGRRRNRYY